MVIRYRLRDTSAVDLGGFETNLQRRPDSPFSLLLTLIYGGADKATHCATYQRSPWSPD
jgi:hypothetical protein